MVPLLESVALTWLRLERCANGLKYIIRCQSTLEGHAIDYELWIEVGSECLPIFSSSLQYIIIVDFKIWSVEALRDTTLNNIRIDRHFFHYLIALMLIRSIVKHLVSPFHVLEEHGLRWQHFDHHLLSNGGFAF